MLLFSKIYLEIHTQKIRFLSQQMVKILSVVIHTFWGSGKFNEKSFSNSSKYCNVPATLVIPIYTNQGTLSSASLLLGSLIPVFWKEMEPVTWLFQRDWARYLVVWGQTIWRRWSHYLAIWAQSISEVVRWRCYWIITVGADVIRYRVKYKYIFISSTYQMWKKPHLLIFFWQFWWSQKFYLTGGWTGAIFWPYRGWSTLKTMGTEFSEDHIDKDVWNRSCATILVSNFLLMQFKQPLRRLAHANLQGNILMGFGFYLVNSSDNGNERKQTNKNKIIKE